MAPVDIFGLVERSKPAAGMVLVQTVFAGVNIFYKLAANDGMDLRVLVAYRHIFGMAFLIPLAFLLERKDRPRLTPAILIQSFFCGLFGGTLTQNLYVVAIKLTTATFTTAIANLVPSITFILAVVFGLERLQMRTMSGQAKVAGTVLGLCGAMLLTFYRGPDINIWTSKIHLLHHAVGAQGKLVTEPGNRVMGSLIAVASCFCYSTWLIIQAKMSRSYPSIYSASALMCTMGALQSTAYGLCMQRDWSQWRLGLDLRLLTVVYAGVFASGVTLMVMAWCIRLKGPLFISVFNPLMLVMVAILSSFLLDEKLHLGSILGGVLIVGGLYLVLWGKVRETAKVAELPVTKMVDNPTAGGLPDKPLDGELPAAGKPAAEVSIYNAGEVIIA